MIKENEGLNFSSDRILLCSQVVLPYWGRSGIL